MWIGKEFFECGMFDGFVYVMCDERCEIIGWF